MSNGDQEQQIDFNVDKNNLYREESVTDLRVASIRRLVPIKLDGTEDESRPPVYVAHTRLMSPEGPVPLQSPLKAVTIEEAVDEFPGAMEAALAEMMERIQTMQEQQANRPREDSRIIVPGR